MIDTGITRLAGMFTDVSLARDVEAFQREVRRMERYCAGDPELEKLHDQLFTLLEARTDTAPPDFTIDNVGAAVVAADMPDFEEVFGISPETWLYRIQQIDATPDGQRRRERVGERIRELVPPEVPLEP